MRADSVYWMSFGNCALGGNCASELMVFLDDVQRSGFVKLINFIPFSCRIHGENAAEIAGTVLRWGRNMGITNIFLDGIEIPVGADTETIEFRIDVSTH
jgi:hypothetical protein